jgi:hypothetical protein
MHDTNSAVQALVKAATDISKVLPVEATRLCLLTFVLRHDGVNHLTEILLASVLERTLDLLGSVDAYYEARRGGNTTVRDAIVEVSLLSEKLIASKAG